MDLNPYTLSSIPGPKPIVLKNDYKIEIGFRDSITGEMLVDCTGNSAVLVSDLLENLPSEALAALLFEVANRMVALAKGVVS
jgi:hypothetical protein